MTKSHSLTKAQKEDLLIEWNTYSTTQQETVLEEFHKNFHGDYSQNDFLQFCGAKIHSVAFSCSLISKHTKKGKIKTEKIF